MGLQKKLGEFKRGPEGAWATQATGRTIRGAVQELIVAKNSAVIPYGRACFYNADGDIEVVKAAGQEFAGVSLCSPFVVSQSFQSFVDGGATPTGMGYQPGEPINLVRQGGDMWLWATVPVQRGQAVYYLPDGTGRYTNVAAGNERLPNARFLGPAKIPGLVMVSLSEA